MRVLVTGGSGYIGTRLMEVLARSPDVQEIVDVDARAPRASMPKVSYVARSVTEDLRDLFTDRARPIDVAIHLAWLFDPIHDAVAQREICVGGTGRFLDGCLAGDVPHVVFMSSAIAYGANPAHARPVDEREPMKERWHFQSSSEKREAEGLFRRFAADRPGTLLQIARPAIVAGPNGSNRLLRLLASRLTFRALGHDPVLQFVHEEDCAEALVAIVRSRLPGAFNVAADGGLTLSRVNARLGARSIPLPLSVLFAMADVSWRRRWDKLSELPPEFTYFLAYPWLVSNRRLKEEVGYHFRYTAEEALDSFVSR